MENDEIPDEVRARMRTAAGRRFDPFVVSLLKRANVVAERREATDITLSDVLEAMLSQPVTPAMVDALLRAGWLSGDRDDGYVGETHVVLALALDELSSLSQLLPAVGIERDMLIDVLRRSLDAGQEWNEHVRTTQDRRDT